MKCSKCSKAKATHFAESLCASVCKGCYDEIAATESGKVAIAQHDEMLAAKERALVAERARKAALSVEERAAEDATLDAANKRHNAACGRYIPSEDILKKAYAGSD